MDRPVEFIRLVDGRWTVMPEAASILSRIEGRVAVVTVAGLYRTGKSFILNRLLEAKDGFTVGPTVNPCTRGIWIWGAPQKRRLPSGETVTVLFLDTEGLASSEQTEAHDAQVMALSLLLSSVFVYNSMGSIDDSAVERLGLVARVTEHIRLRAEGSAGAAGADAAQQLRDEFPVFVWLLRDFALQLEDERGHPISEREYLERALRPLPGTGATVRTKNETRQRLRELFPVRECATLVRPVSDESELRNLAAVPESRLRPEFRRQLASFTQLVASLLRPKRVMGQFVNGIALAALAEQYTAGLSAGTAPVIATAWEATVHLTQARAEQAALAALEEGIATITGRVPLAEPDLDSALQGLRQQVLATFDRQSVGDGSYVRLRLEETIHTRAAAVRERNAQEWQHRGMAILHGLYQRMHEFIHQGAGYRDLSTWDSDRRKLEHAYLDRMPAFAGREAALVRFYDQRVFPDLQHVHSKIVQQTDATAAARLQGELAAARQQDELHQQQAQLAVERLKLELHNATQQAGKLQADLHQAQERIRQLEAQGSVLERSLRSEAEKARADAGTVQRQWERQAEHLRAELQTAGQQLAAAQQRAAEAERRVQELSLALQQSRAAAAAAVAAPPPPPPPPAVPAATPGTGRRRAAAALAAMDTSGDEPLYPPPPPAPASAAPTPRTPASKADPGRETFISPDLLRGPPRTPGSAASARRIADLDASDSGAAAAADGSDDDERTPVHTGKRKRGAGASDADRFERMTVAELLSALSAAGVELPNVKQKKPFYVQLARQHLA